MRVVFFGSDKYSQIVLNHLRQDKNIKITKTITDASMIRTLEVNRKYQPEVGVLASFGAIIPKKILDLFPWGILNLHPSLLPKYRGPSPVQTAILNGEKQTGITIIKMDEKIDHGPIVAQFTEEILPTDTAESLYFRLFTVGAQIIKTILPDYLEGRIKLRQQDHSQATYTKKLTRQDGFIPQEELKKAMMGKKAREIDRKIRAYYSWPGVWTEVKINRKSLSITRKLKVLKAHLKNQKLVLDVVQLEGKKPVSFKQFCEGYPQALFSPWE